MTKDEFFKLCTALVQDRCTPGSLHHLLSALGSPPGMADAMHLKPNWSIEGEMGNIYSFDARKRIWTVHIQNR